MTPTGAPRVRSALAGMAAWRRASSYRFRAKGHVATRQGRSALGSRSLRVGVVGVGNCASSFVQGLTYYRDATPDEPVPGLMNVSISAATTSRTSRSSAAFDVTAAQGRPRRCRGDLRGAEQHAAISPAPPPTGVIVERGPTLDGLGRYLTRRNRGIRRAARRRRGHRCAGPRTDVLVSYLPVGSQQADRVLRRAGAGGGLRLRQLHPGLHRLGPATGAARFEERGLPIIGDDIKSQVGATIVHRVLTNLFRERGVQARPHLPAQFRRQHRLPEHAGARAAGVEEDLQDAGRDEPARRAARRRRRPCRPERPRAVARRPQVVLHPHGGHRLRRRAAEPRAEARGLGFARTPPASSSMRCAAPSWRWTAASAAR